MSNLQPFISMNVKRSKKLSEAEKLSVRYHNIFDFPLSFSDLVKWRTSENVKKIKSNLKIDTKGGYYFIAGNSASIYKRQLHTRISKRKLLLAQKVANIISHIPSVRMVAVTGSLAMQNSKEESDIDLMVVTGHGKLWTTRLFVYILLGLFRIEKRRPNDKIEKDKLCLNIWLDEKDLGWKSKQRNLYTAHEIAQIVPLVNKDESYEKFIFKNKWILDFWPNSVEKKYMVYKRSLASQGSGSKSHRGKDQYTTYNILNSWLENVCFQIQYKYMKPKMSRESVTPTRALFHPQDWSSIVLQRLS